MMEIDEKQPAADEEEKLLTIASQVPFHDFAMVCEKTTKTQGKEKKKEFVKKFLAHWRNAHQKMHGIDSKTVCILVVYGAMVLCFESEILKEELYVHDGV